MDACGAMQVRGAAVEELELTVSRLQRTSAVIPHIQPLIEFLSGLFSDDNMKVSIGSLEVRTLPCIDSRMVWCGMRSERACVCVCVCVSRTVDGSACVKLQACCRANIGLCHVDGHVLCV